MIKRILKISGVILLAAFTLIVAVALTINFFFKDKLIQFAVSEINKTIETQIDVQSIELSFWQSFPYVGVQFNQILIHSSKPFRKANPKASDTLLSAKTALVNFDVLKVLKSNFVIRNVDIANGKANLLTDAQGLSNYEIVKRDSAAANGSSAFNLQRLKLSKVSLFYTNQDVTVKSYIDESRSSVSIQENKTLLNSVIRLNNCTLIVGKEIYTLNNIIQTSINIDYKNDVLKLESSSFACSDVQLKFRSTLKFGKRNYVENYLVLENQDVDKVLSIIPVAALSQFKSQYQCKGTFDLNMSLTGFIDQGLKLSCSVKLSDGLFADRKSNISLSNVTSSFNYICSSIDNIESSVTQINKLEFNVGKNRFVLDGNVNGIFKPKVNLNLSSALNINELKSELKIDTLDVAQGTAKVKINILGTLSDVRKFKPEMLQTLYYTGSVSFEDVAVKLKGNDYKAERLTGSCVIQNDLIMSDVSFVIHDNAYKVNGRIFDFQNYIHHSTNDLIVKADVASPDLDLSRYFTKKPSTESSDSPELLFPANLQLDVTLKVDKFKLNTFNAKYINCNLSYKPKMIVLKSLSFESMSGKVSGNGAFMQSYSHDFLAQGSFALSNIDLRGLFTSMNNFGQSTLRDEHLKGNLNGKVKLAVEWDRKFNLHSNKLLAEADFAITKGELNNFEPLKEVSKFLKLKDVESIKFSTLKNTIYIKGNQIVIPNMEIASSALNLWISGTHQLDNHYSYNLKLLLSQILWGKARKAKSETGDFAVSENDRGFGIYLVVEGYNSQCKVKYDTKRTLGLARESLKNQKKELKTIFSEEFGWNKTDSILAKPASLKPRVEWEDADPVKEAAKPEPTPTKAPKKEKIKVEWE